MVEIRKHVMEKQGKKLKLIVARDPLRHSSVKEIKSVLKAEHSKDTPILFVLPEFFHGLPLVETPIVIKKMKLALGPKPKARATGYNSEVLENLKALQKLAKKYNAHLLYAGMESETERNSAFLLTPAGPAIVRRKITWATENPEPASESSVKVINIDGFHVLPLICYEFGQADSLHRIISNLDKRFENTVDELAKQNNWSKARARKHLSKTMPFYTKGVDIVAVPSEVNTWKGQDLAKAIDILSGTNLVHSKTVFANTGMKKFEYALLDLTGNAVGKKG